MKKVSLDEFMRLRKLVYRSARPLEYTKWKFLFENGSCDAFLEVLSSYQNEDGGFGHNIECNNWNPGSAPYTVCIALDALDAADGHESGMKDKIIAGILRYLSSEAYLLEDGWVGMQGIPGNNDFSHMPWFHFDAEKAARADIGVTKRLADFILRYGEKDSPMRIIFKCKEVREAVFYAQYTLENNWSRGVLEHQIESGLYERKGKAITNFKDKLPANASDLAIQTLKDPYSFDFLAMGDDYDEKELEDALVNQITQFLLELGTGFSYVGRQVHLQVGEREFYIDLLFYHIKLHCYVVVELKTKRFEPEYVGKLNFYVTAVNKQLTGNGDNPAIGLLICKDKDNVVAEYSLEEVSQPIGIAGYELSDALSKEYQRSLPTIETLESEVAKMMDTK